MYSHNCHIQIIWSTIDMNKTVCFEFWWKKLGENCKFKIRWKIGSKIWLKNLFENLAERLA